MKIDMKPLFFRAKKGMKNDIISIITIIEEVLIELQMLYIPISSFFTDNLSAQVSALDHRSEGSLQKIQINY